MGKKHFCFFQTAEFGNRTPNSGVKGSGANKRAAGSPKDAYLRSVMLIYVHGHIKVYLKGNFAFLPMVPAVEQWLSAKIVKIRVKDRRGVN